MGLPPLIIPPHPPLPTPPPPLPLSYQSTMLLPYIAPFSPPRDPHGTDASIASPSVMFDASTFHTLMKQHRLLNAPSRGAPAASINDDLNSDLNGNLNSAPMLVYTGDATSPTALSPGSGRVYTARDVDFTTDR